MLFGSRLYRQPSARARSGPATLKEPRSRSRASSHLTRSSREPELQSWCAWRRPSPVQSRRLCGSRFPSRKVRFGATLSWATRGARFAALVRAWRRAELPSPGRISLRDTAVEAGLLEMVGKIAGALGIAAGRGRRPLSPITSVPRIQGVGPGRRRRLVGWWAAAPASRMSLGTALSSPSPRRGPMRPVARCSVAGGSCPRR